MSAPAEELTFTAFEEEGTNKSSRARSLLSAAPKGFQKTTGPQIRQALEFLPKLFGLEGGEAPVTEEEASEKIEKLFPTRQGFAESSLERTGSLLPYALMGSGSVLSDIIASGAGGLAGQATEELGGGEIMQSIAEGAPFLFKNLLKKGGEALGRKAREIGQIGKSLGLTPEEISPLQQSTLKQKTIGKVAEKGKVGEGLERTRKGLQRVYGDLAQGGTAKRAVPEAMSKMIDNQMEKIFSRLSTKAQDVLEKPFQRYLQSPKTGEDLIRFYGDINELYPKQSTTSAFKNPIRKALKSISPELAQDFELTNNLYSKYHSIANRLKPGLENQLINAGEAGKIALDLVSGNVSGLQKVLGVVTGRQLAAEMLINPRLQNFSSKFVSALNQNKPIVAKQMMDKIINTIGNQKPGLSKELRKFDLEGLADLKLN